MSYSISQLSKIFNLSRGTLLYYDKIGLLKPSGRKKNNYRVYSEADYRRLEQIHTYRQTGITLEEIEELLADDAHDGTLMDILEKRLEHLNQELNRVRGQQRLIIGILKNKELMKRIALIQRDTLVEILELAGLDEDDMDRLHARLERKSPEGHQVFLEALGIDADEIALIREYSKAYRL